MSSNASEAALPESTREIEAVAAGIRTRLEHGQARVDLSESRSVGASAFSRWFSARMGITFREYVAGLKVERGIPGLLRGGPVIESQLDAGYESAASFSHAFRAHTGLTPRQYRQRAPGMVDAALKEVGEAKSRSFQHLAFNPDRHRQPHALTVKIEGRVHDDSLIFVGFYPRALPKGAPMLGYALVSGEECVVEAIPDGAYVPMAVEVRLGADLFTCFHLDHCRRALAREGMAFPLSQPQEIVLTLRDRVPSDPPIAVNLLHLLLEAVRGRKSRQMRPESIG